MHPSVAGILFEGEVQSCKAHKCEKNIWGLSSFGAYFMVSAVFFMTQAEEARKEKLGKNPGFSS